MFSGIVDFRLAASDVSLADGVLGFSLTFPPSCRRRLVRGNSVSVNGVCLTLTECSGGVGRFDCIDETLRTTTLSDLKEGDLVNVEFSLRSGGEIGGHLVSGHVDDVARIVEVRRPDAVNVELVLEVSPRCRPYVFSKGYVAVNGCSLTVGAAERDTGRFSLHLIPETLRRTNLGEVKEGDSVNLEVDKQTQAVVETMRGFLTELRAEVLAGRVGIDVVERSIGQKLLD